MADRADITPELCRQLLRYDPDSGQLFWLPRPSSMFRDVTVNGGFRSAQAAADAFNVKCAGKEAFTATNDAGYRVGAILGTMQRAHRVAWAIVHGEWPDQIDHINGGRADNRLANLRAVSNAENHRNEGKPKNNTSGVVGVIWCKQTGKWRAQIKVNYRNVQLGRFSRIEDAAAAREEAKRRYRFDDGHGTREAWK